MFNMNEQFAAANKSAVDASMRFAQLALESTERLMKLQVDAVRSTLEENVKTAKAVAEAKDLQELSAIQSKMAEGLVERATSYTREVYEVASQSQSKMAKLAEESLAAGNERVMGAIDTVLKSAPAGSDAAVSAFKSSMGVAAKAVESIAKAAQQVTNITEANIKAAEQNIKAAAKKAA